VRLGVAAGSGIGLAPHGQVAANDPGGVVLMVCVELCSLAFRINEPSKADIVATALFGDGAAACVLRAGEGGLAHSRSLGGLHTVNFSLCYLAAVHHFRGDSRAALRRSTESLELAREQGFATWIGVSQMIRGESLVRGGEVAAGLKEIAAGMDAHRGMEATTYQPFGLSLLANGLVAAGRLDEALEAVDDALAISERSGERFYLAELVRLKGEVLARKGSPSEAERWLREAIRVSRQQGARLFELRSAVSLCSVLDEPRRETALHDVVEPIYGWFEEGSDAPDLRAARALLTTGTRAT